MNAFKSIYRKLTTSEAKLEEEKAREQEKALKEQFEQTQANMGRDRLLKDAIFIKFLSDLETLYTELETNARQETLVNDPQVKVAKLLTQSDTLRKVITYARTGKSEF